MSNIEAVIAKVQKLLSLGKNNSNEHEAMAALAAADRIMAEYRISAAQVEAQDASKAEPFIRKTIYEGGRRTKWREILIGALVHNYGCAWYLSSRQVRNNSSEVAFLAGQ